MDLASGMIPRFEQTPRIDDADDCRELDWSNKMRGSAGVSRRVDGPIGHGGERSRT